MAFTRPDGILYHFIILYHAHHHLRIEVGGVLMDQSQLAGVGHNQGEAQEDHQNVQTQQSLLTSRFCQQSQADGGK